MMIDPSPGRATPAGAAEELLDTITVPANSSTVIQGTYQLKVGTRYVIEVSGTMTSTNTQGGYGAAYDALAAERRQVQARRAVLLGELRGVVARLN